jgi:hypothetical protein
LGTIAAESFARWSSFFKTSVIPAKLVPYLIRERESRGGGQNPPLSPFTKEGQTNRLKTMILKDNRIVSLL